MYFGFSSSSRPLHAKVDPVRSEVDRGVGSSGFCSMDFLVETTRRNCIENNWTSQLDWLVDTGGPTFLDPGVWKGLHIDGDIMKAGGATDLIVVQARLQPHQR